MECGVTPDQILDVYPCTALQEGLIAITAHQPAAYTARHAFALDHTVDTGRFKVAWEHVVPSFAILQTRTVPLASLGSMQVVIQERLQWQQSSDLHKHLAKDQATPMSYGAPLSRSAIVEELTAGERYFDEAKTRDFWRQQLDDAGHSKFPVLPTPTYEPQASRRLHHRISGAQRPGRVTTSIVLRAAWALVVAAHTGADEAVINVVTSGRTGPVLGLMDVIVPTATTVPVRVCLDQECVVSKLLADLQEQATQMIPYEHTGLHNIRRMVPSLGSDFDAGHLFVVQTVAEASALLNQFEQYFKQLLRVSVSDDTAEASAIKFVRDLQMLSPVDAEAIRKWNGEVPPRMEACIHDLVRETVTIRPTAPAVCAWDGDLTYSELHDFGLASCSPPRQAWCPPRDNGRPVYGQVEMGRRRHAGRPAGRWRCRAAGRAASSVSRGDHPPRHRRPDHSGGRATGSTAERPGRASCDCGGGVGIGCTALTCTVAKLINPNQVPLLKNIILTGEVVTAVVVEQWLPYAQVRNAYGPAECFMTTCSRPVRRKEDAGVIGFPLACRIWVTHRNDPDRLCSLGMPGELLIEGPILARGYLNDIEKTAASFIVDPAFVSELSLAPGRRMYRTGDLVRQNYDDSYTHMGRRDTQIKIHGQRVEIGEIESWIQHFLPESAMIVVSLVKRPGSQEKFLTAILSLKSAVMNFQRSDRPSVLDHSDRILQMFRRLQSSLLQVMPRYMVPSFFVPVTHLPLNVSGKLDRKKIDAWFRTLNTSDWDRHATDKSAQTLLTANESTLSNVGISLLSIEQRSIGPETDFFDLGGDSVFAVRLVASLREKHFTLSVANVFAHPLLAEMAFCMVESSLITNSAQLYKPFSLLKIDDVNQYLDDVVYSAIMGRKSNDSLDVIPLTDFQAMIIEQRQMSVDVDQNYFAMKGVGSCELGRLARCCAQLIDDNECFRTAFIFDQDETPMQVVLGSTRADVVTYITDIPIQGFLSDLLANDMFRMPRSGQPPIHAAIVSNETTQEHCLLFRMSHAIYDNQTLSMMWRAIQSLYNRQSSKKRSPFSSYFSNLMLGFDIKSLDYWRDHLRGSSMTKIGSVEPLARGRLSFDIESRTKKDISSQRHHVWSQPGSSRQGCVVCYPGDT
nr:nonribosomal peptide synthetase easa [Quercus suber]